jgi:hypothetical protein
MAPFVIKLEVHQRSTYLSARCAEVPGLHITGSDLEDLRRRAMPAVKRLLLANRHIDADVLPTDELTELRVRPRNAAA